MLWRKSQKSSDKEVSGKTRLKNVILLNFREQIGQQEVSQLDWF